MRQDDELTPEIMAAAAAWLSRVSQCNDRGRREFVGWLTHDRRHLQAVLQMWGLERRIDELPMDAWRRLKKVLHADPSAGAAQRIPPLWGRLATRLEEVLFSRLATVIASFLAFMFAIQVASHDMAPQFQTRVGERRLVELKDGSLIHLNTNSHVRVDFSSRRRTVHLLQGEALFVVAFDPDRPFDVRMDHVVVRAMGTQFNVYRHQDTIVSVLDGRVQILESASGTLLPRSHFHAEISKAEEATLHVSPQGLQVEVAPITAMALSQRRAWTKGSILMNGEPLGYVIGQFNRYHRTQLVIEDSDFDGPRLGGVIQINDLAQFVQFITDLHGLKATESGPPHARTIHLKRSAATDDRTPKGSAESVAASSVQ